MVSTTKYGSIEKAPSMRDHCCASRGLIGRAALWVTIVMALLLLGHLTLWQHQVELHLDATEFTVYGLECADTIIVHRPHDEGSYPLVVFAPGDLERVAEWDARTRYDALLRGVAEAGFVVVAPLASGKWCPQAAFDQRRIVNFVLDNADSWSRIDWTGGVGVYGVSMGGLAALVNAQLNTTIGAAVAIAPFWDGVHLMLDGVTTELASHLVVPTFLVGASRDTQSTPELLTTVYDEIRVPKALAIVENRTHNDIRESPDAVFFVRTWFGCFLRGVKSDCAVMTVYSAGTSFEAALGDEPRDHGPFFDLSHRLHMTTWPPVRHHHAPEPA